MTTIVTSGYSLTQTLIRTVNKTITPTEKWVLVVIADTCNAEEKWQGYPSVTTIAERTGFSRKAVSSALKSLKDQFLSIYHVSQPWMQFVHPLRNQSATFLISCGEYSLC